MKRFLHNLLIALFLVALCAVSSVAHDVEAIGKVVALRGEVNASSASGATRRLAVKMPVYLEDSIQTGNRGRVQILFSDKTIVSLGPKTDMRIAEYSWRPQQQQGAMKTVVKEGVFRVMGGSITRVAPEHFTTETPSATIGIRGSMYSGRVTAGQTLVLFEGGRGIYIANPSGQVEIATPGYASSAGDPGQPPSEAEQVEPEQLSTFSTDVAVDDDAEGGQMVCQMVCQIVCQMVCQMAQTTLAAMTRVRLPKLRTMIVHRAATLPAVMKPRMPRLRTMR